MIKLLAYSICCRFYLIQDLVEFVRKLLFIEKSENNHRKSKFDKKKIRENIGVIVYAVNICKMFLSENKIGNFLERG